MVLFHASGLRDLAAQAHEYLYRNHAADQHHEATSFHTGQWPFKCGQDLALLQKRLREMTHRQDKVLALAMSSADKKKMGAANSWGGPAKDTNDGDQQVIVTKKTPQRRVEWIKGSDPEQDKHKEPEVNLLGGEKQTHHDSEEPHIELNALGEFMQGGPFPLSHRISEVATNSYYLHAMAKNLKGSVTLDTPEGVVAENIEDEAQAGRWSSLKTAHDFANQEGKDKITFQHNPPYLPMVTESEK